MSYEAKRGLRDKSSDEADANRMALSLIAFSYSMSKYWKCMATYIAQKKMLFTYTDDPRYVKDMRNSFSLNFMYFSRHTVRHEAMRLFSKKKRGIEKKNWHCCTTLYFMSNMWRNMNESSYICAAVYSIDDDWVMHKKFLVFIMFCSHITKTIFFSCLGYITRF